MIEIEWRKDKATGHYVGTVSKKPVARIVRLAPSAWKWSYRGIRDVRTTVDEARLLKHAKEAIERLHASKQAIAKLHEAKRQIPQNAKEHGNESERRLKATAERRRETERSRQETEAGRRVGRAAEQTTPSGGGDRDRQGPHLFLFGEEYLGG